MPVAGTSVHPHHDTGGLDDRIRTLAYLKAQAFGGTFGDDRSDQISSGQLNDNLGVDDPDSDAFHCALQNIFGADFHSGMWFR